MKKSFVVSVPASSGNIGPGFDVLGLALTLRNELRVRLLNSNAPKLRLRILGEGENTLPQNASNVVYKTMEGVFRKAKRPIPNLELVCVNRIPLTRGLGSSSSAFLCGLLAANALLGNKFDSDQILSWATGLEGHPDNVAPALLGGVRASAVFGKKVVTSLVDSPKTTLVLAVPQFELSTKKARKVLPKKVTMKDAISNLAAVSLLPHAFRRDATLLKDLLNDRWHEPYRAKLIPGFWKVKSAALKAGAYGVALSGAGPSMIAFVPAAKNERVAQAMQNAFRRAGVKSRTMKLSVDTRGAVVK